VSKIAQPCCLLQKVYSVLYVAKYSPGDYDVNHLFSNFESVFDVTYSVQHVDVRKQENPVYTVEHTRVKSQIEFYREELQ